MTELRIENWAIPGARLGEENPLPIFRDPARDLQVRTHPSLPAEKREWLGWEAAFRVLPYRMQDGYSRRREPLNFRAVVLENEVLRATFLPELGGRLVSLVHRPQERELLHRNPVFQPANLAIRNAWFSGGVEWNIGQFGHTFTTCAPLFAAQIEGAQGEPGLRLYEYERCKGLFWQIDFYLPPGFPFLIAYTRVVNPNPRPVSMYWWTNVAVDERPGTRVLAPADQAIYASFEPGGASFGLGSLPNLPSLQGADGTYSLNSTFANEFFFQCEAAEMPWEAALDQEGHGFVEASTGRLRYRKLFCWGTHAGGRHWQEFLAQPGEAYLEIQAGLAPTQLHGLPMPADSTWDWTQALGYLEADPAAAHHADWRTAWTSVGAALRARLSPQELARIEASCRARADLPAQQILQHGSGWGALELRRRTPDPALRAFIFPESSLSAGQSPWLTLLETGRLPEQDPACLPGEWMVQEEWQQLLEASLQVAGGRHWYALLHAGVMRMERLDPEGAAQAWRESIRLNPSAWAHRNLAVYHLRRGEAGAALDDYALAWQLASQSGDPAAALAIEYLDILFQAGQFERGLQVYTALPGEVQQVERIQMLRGRFALQLGDLDAVEQALQREYATVREGETVLTDLWFELHARREAQRSGGAVDDALREAVRLRYPPPARIDFRSFNE